VRVTSWYTVKSTYDVKISYRLAVFEDKERTGPKVVTKFVEEYDKKSYTKNPLKLFRALFNKNKESPSKSLTDVFCCELSA
jgi:hypothetical protein